MKPNLFSGNFKQEGPRLKK